jgi:hypothetical protein
MKCNQCQSEMVKDCKVNVEFDTPGITISKKREGTFQQSICKIKSSRLFKLWLCSFLH